MSPQRSNAQVALRISIRVLRVRLRADTCVALYRDGCLKPAVLNAQLTRPGHNRVFDRADGFR
ncbi:MAG: hypothetical protein JWS11_2048 [Cypionkella sp.]|nr:hypothetical protein [Cypionkella sp.]